MALWQKLHVYRSVTGLLSTKESSLTPHRYSKPEQTQAANRAQNVQNTGLFCSGSLRNGDGIVRNKVGNSTFGKAVTDGLFLGLGVLLGASGALVDPNTHSLGSHLLLSSDGGRSLQGEVEKKGKNTPKEQARLHRAFHWVTCRSVLFSLDVTKP